MPFTESLVRLWGPQPSPGRCLQNDPRPRLNHCGAPVQRSNGLTVEPWAVYSVSSAV